MRDQRRLLRGGTVPVHPRFSIPDFAWHGGIPYSTLDGRPDSFKWWLACLGFLRLLIDADRLSEDDAATCRTIVEDFQSQNPESHPALSRAWDGHAVALRSEVLVDIARGSADPTWMAPILAQHVAFLEAEEHFQGDWNHGVDQARALVVAASHVKDDRARALGLARLRRALEVIVDAEGVSIEQAVHYHHYNLLQLRRSLELLHGTEVPAPELKSIAERLARMPELLAHATRPDGTWFELGDTPWQAAQPVVGTIAEFAATRGIRGPRPDAVLRVFEAGYAFGRSGWGTARAFEDETAYALRFGPQRRLHGHHDHTALSYFTGGVDFLRDGGFHGYTDDDQRGFLRSMEAHNRVTPLGPPPRSDPRDTQLVEHQSGVGWQRHHIVFRGLRGMTIARSVLFSFEPHVLVVLDTVESEQERDFAQRWHFGRGVRLTPDGSTVRARFAGREASIMQHMPFSTLETLEAADPRAPRVAGRSMYETERCTSMSTIASGRTASFLTTFAFDGAPSVAFQPAAAGELDRLGTLVWQAAGEGRASAAPAPLPLSLRVAVLRAGLLRRLDR